MMAHEGHTGVQHSGIMAMGNIVGSDTTLQKRIKVESGVMVVQAAVTVSGASAECKLNGQRLLSLLTHGPFLCVTRIHVDA